MLRILKKKIIFRRYKQVKILSDFNFNLDIHPFFLFNTNELNVYYLIISLIKKIYFYITNNSQPIRVIYFKEVISSLDPKIVISSELSRVSFKVKKYFVNIICLTYQQASYFENMQELTPLIYANEKTDYFFLHSKYYLKFFDFIDTNFLFSGSLKINEKSYQKISNKYDIMFISEFREKELSQNLLSLSNLSDSQNNFKNTISVYVLKLLSEYCLVNDKKIAVALSSNRKDKANSGISKKKEINFFKKYLKNNFHYEDCDSFDLSEKCNLIICLTSNLGPELLMLKKKVLFLNPDFFILNWQILPNKEGPFWYKGSSKNKIFTKIDELLNMNEYDWKDILNKSNLDLNYDFKNTALKNLIVKLLS